MPTPYPQEQMHRIKYTKLTPASAPVSASPLSDVLAGTTVRIVLDGTSSAAPG